VDRKRKIAETTTKEHMLRVLWHMESITLLEGENIPWILFSKVDDIFYRIVYWLMVLIAKRFRRGRDTSNVED
jgi:hypothetical protein